MHKGSRRVSPLTVPIFAPNMASSQVSIILGIRGPVFTSLAACASGVHGFFQALRLIQAGDAEVVVAGASEAAVTPLSVSGFANARALSFNNDDPAGACRPFDRARDGFVMSEGGVAMVLESVEHARRRGARIYAALAGGAATGDAYHITDPLPDGYGASLAMRRAMADAGLAPADIDYICAHATATPVGDIAEVAAIRDAFGPAADRVVVSAPKSMIGHMMGAAGAAAGVAAVLAIANGVIPPTINLTDPDPECDRRLPADRRAPAAGARRAGQRLRLRRPERLRRLRRPRVSARDGAGKGRLILSLVAGAGLMLRARRAARQRPRQRGRRAVHTGADGDPRADGDDDARPDLDAGPDPNAHPDPDATDRHRRDGRPPDPAGEPAGDDLLLGPDSRDGRAAGRHPRSRRPARAGDRPRRRCRRHRPEQAAAAGCDRLG